MSVGICRSQRNALFAKVGRRGSDAQMYRHIFFMCAVLTAALSSCLLRAADFPQKPVRIVVGYAPGGGADLLARVIGRKLAERWGQAVVVENRAGAGGTIAANLVAHSAPDGYTMLLITSNHSVPSTEYKNPGYDPLKDFAPVMEVAYIPGALITNPVVPAGTLRELIDLAKANPGALNFGSTGTSSAQFMETQLFMNLAGIRMVNVTYKGASPILVALLSNEIQLSLQPVTAFMESVRAGKLKALAVSGKVRSSLLPTVPTYREAAGPQGFEGSANWYGMVTPAGTPREIVNKLHAAIATAINMPDVQRLLAEQAYITVAGSPEEFAKRMADDLTKWTSIAKSIRIN